MTGRTTLRWFSLLIAVAMASLMLACVQGGEHPGSASTAVPATAPRHPFPQHVSYAAGSIRPDHRSQAQLDDDVRAAYERWKANYLREAGTDGEGHTLYRISYGSVNPDRTVSEGQGYGMIIVALMAGYDSQAQALFDGLLRFALAHPSNVDPRLMAWEIPEPSGGTDCAFDGDADIAYALLLADAQWGSAGEIDYRAAAEVRITALAESAVGPNSRLPLLGDWVEADDEDEYTEYTVRTSDFMPAHFRAYARATGRSLWTEVVSATQAAVDHIQADYSPQTGLLPDFLVPVSEEDHTLRPAYPYFLEGPHDGDYDYNAGRDPWRIGTDALLYGDARSREQARRMADWIVAATGGDPANILAGYTLDGQPTGDYFTSFFAAPFGVALMLTPEHQDYLNALYDLVVQRHEDYYEDTVTLLTLLVMTGNYWDPTLIGDQAGTGPDFPRLGMWWPDPWEQPITDIARYDWVILGPWESEFITPIKQINPDILLLNSTNACEIAYNPDPSDPYAEEENAEVLAIPPEWFLTQVGTTLTVGVDEVITTFHVAAVTVSDGSAVYDLFVPGDTALIEGESLYVEAVDAAAKTLTVRRGYVRPASPHEAGVRIAAHITFWPDTWLLNLSTACPTATISSTIGAEQWADYNARRAVALLDAAPWDGLLIDRADPNESWLIGNSTARTIDPDQSNRLLTDYSAFDDAWNAGLRHYEEAVRAAVGDERIIFVNLGMPNYDLLNGNNFEGFPLDDGTSYAASWHRTVFGPLPDGGSYFDWMRRARSPNLTMIETYEDDGGPDPTGDGSYDNPCDDPGFVPNYRKMRFGLATALLNDGYFSYEINTNGHGSLCLLWFDEYDDGGRQRGYLGQPLGAAYRIGEGLLGDDLLTGGGFESEAELEGWDLWADTENGYSATVSLDETGAAVGQGAARIEIGHSAGTDWRVSFSFAPVDLISGTEYTLDFWARADRERTIGAWAQQNAEPWTVYLDFEAFPLTTTWQHFELPLRATGSDPQALFSFGVGAMTGTVWLDEVRLRPGNADLWRRDFEHGVALVNATALTQTVALGEPLRHLTGTQVPTLNNGALITEVTLPPLDGLILLRPTPPIYRLYLPVILRH